MNVLFTSDLHLGHRFVSELRGFNSVEEHDQAIVDNWWSAVGKNDQVWVLGDIAVSNPYTALDTIAELPGTKHLISGNHDACHSLHRDAHKWLPRYLTAFASIQTFARRRVLGKEVLLSHFPYLMDRHEPRYMQYRLPDKGSWLLHGHTHSNVRLVGHELHVGLDAWNMKLVPLSEIERIINTESSQS